MCPMGPIRPPGIQEIGAIPCENLVMDFTELPQAGGYWYMLVLICTFSRWMEAFPTRTEKAWEVTTVLIKDIIPRFRLPLTLGSDNGLAFVAKIVQGLTRLLKIKWKLHTAYRPQSSGKVERINQKLKQLLKKILPRNPSEMGSGPAHGSPLSQVHLRVRCPMRSCLAGHLQS